ncbi:unnamed protein product [Rhizoctonia solani]|uniref:T6SS Phospholipase effector Tle1-like catalytic domain-containing protein n=1 Tax=Rhizoctonia solani TaxID=456999 RepID=A0A8H3I1B2_9AGAM|nr:unnamed protein product [Rhizoctonia solani]
MSLEVPQDATMLSPGSDRPRYHSFRSGTGTHLTGKDILVFCDGTGKDGKLGTSSTNKTNVWRLYQLTLSLRGNSQGGWGPFHNSTLRQTEIIYLPGVGSGSSRNPYNLLVRIFGTTIVENIVQAYLHVAEHYEAGSKVYLFGYSRGAFVVRKVASLLYRIGIIRDREKVLKLWDHQERPIPWNLIDSPPRGERIRIQGLVVWDTVGAIRSVHHKSKMEADILGMPDTELPPNVIHAFHVVAFHENRKLFRVTLFQPDPKKEHNLKEVWFPGAHSDVGGGDIKRVGLPNISLIWIIGELQTSCSLPISHDNLEYPTDIQSLSPSDAYHDTPKWKRIVDKCETRLGLLCKTSLVHETVLYLKNTMPDYLDPRSKPKTQMLTINDLGLMGWDVKANLVVRNAFESLKHSHAMAKARYRNRVSSLYQPRKPDSPATSTNQTPGTDEHIPRPSRRSSIAGNRPPDNPTPLSPAPPKISTRLRAGSHVPARSQSFVPGQAARPEPTSEVRTPARRGTHPGLGGVLAFQEYVPRYLHPFNPDDTNANSRRKHRGEKARPEEVQRHSGKSGL